MKTFTYKGWLVHGNNSEDDRMLGLMPTRPKNPAESVYIPWFGDDDEGRYLADAVSEDLEVTPTSGWPPKRKAQVSVRYYLCDQECTEDEAQEQFLRRLDGDITAVYYSHYSEYTGYLWTDEELQVGGHNLLAELKGNIGKYLILIVDLHD